VSIPFPSLWRGVKDCPVFMPPIPTRFACPTFSCFETSLRLAYEREPKRLSLPLLEIFKIICACRRIQDIYRSLSSPVHELSLRAEVMASERSSGIKTPLSFPPPAERQPRESSRGGFPLVSSTPTFLLTLIFPSPPLTRPFFGPSPPELLPPRSFFLCGEVQLARS